MNKVTLGIVVTSLFIQLSDKEIDIATAILSKYFDVKLYLPKGEPDEFGSIPITQMIKLINSASSECEVLLSLCGGFNQVELLTRFDELKLKKENIFVGQSDNTILVNALPALGICKSLYGKGFYDIAKSAEQSSRLVKELYQSVTKLKNDEAVTIEGTESVSGTLIGGNNYTFDLLQGTRFCPSLKKPYILFMEGEDILRDSTETWVDFIRNIDSILLQDGAKESLRAVILGKFPDSIKPKPSDIKKFLDDRPLLKDAPLILDFPCGHNKESVKYLPIGQELQIKC